MEILLSEDDHKLLDLAYKIVEKWRTIMNVDPIWQITIQVVKDMDESIAFLKMTHAANYRAKICIHYDLFSNEEATFLSEIELIVCHELLHLVTEDFMRTALLAAGYNRKLIDELRYKCEQFTSRLQKTILNLVKESK